VRDSTGQGRDAHGMLQVLGSKMREHVRRFESEVEGARRVLTATVQSLGARPPLKHLQRGTPASAARASSGREARAPMVAPLESKEQRMAVREMLRT